MMSQSRADPEGGAPPRGAGVGVDTEGLPETVGAVGTFGRTVCCSVSRKEGS